MASQSSLYIERTGFSVGVFRTTPIDPAARIWECKLPPFILGDGHTLSECQIPNDASQIKLR